MTEPTAFNTTSSILDADHTPSGVQAGVAFQCAECAYPVERVHGRWEHRTQPIALAAVRREYGEPATGEGS